MATFQHGVDGVTEPVCAKCGDTQESHERMLPMAPGHPGSRQKQLGQKWQDPEQEKMQCFHSSFLIQYCPFPGTRKDRKVRVRMEILAAQVSPRTRTTNQREDGARGESRGTARGPGGLGRRGMAQSVELKTVSSDSLPRCRTGRWAPSSGTGHSGKPMGAWGVGS